MAEEYFPRGKSKILEPRKTDIENESENTSDAKEKTPGAKVKRFSRKRQSAEEDPFQEAKRFKKNQKEEKLESPLQNEVICPNLVSLACVRQAHDYNVSLSLPGSHMATLPITNISKAYSNKLKEIAQQEGDQQPEDFSPAEDFFHSGLLVPVVMKEITDDKNKTKKALTVATDPALINSNLPIRALQDGMMLIGNISSVEDHGYGIDLGVRGLQGFLKAKDAAKYIKKFHNGKQLPVGMPVWCVLQLKGKTVEEIKDTRVVNVSIDPKEVKDARIPDTANLNAILPGMKTDVVVEKCSEHGLTVKFHSFQGMIHCSHLPRSSYGYDIGKEMTAVVLYVHPESKVIHLTALPHITAYEGGPLTLFGNLKIGNKMQATVQRTVRRKGLFLQLSDSHRAFAALSQLTDVSAEPDLTKFSRGMETECRVMGFNFIEGLVLVTLKDSILSQKFITVTDMKPGDFVEGIISEVLTNGVIVMLSRKIYSFISTLHLSDVPIKNPDKKFKEGMKLRCKVMKIDADRKKVFLTHKKSLMKSKFPLITDYSQIKPYMELEGVISMIRQKALDISFFSRVRGYVLCRDMSMETVEDPSALFYVGQVVRCCVIYINADEKRLRLSLNLGMPRAPKKRDVEKNEKKEKKDEPLSYGTLFEVKIVRTEKSGFRVQVVGGQTQALLPFAHLSDYHEVQELRKMHFKPGHVIPEVTLFSSRLGNIVTMKESLLQAASEDCFVKSFGDLEPGKLLPGVINNHQDYGVFVELVGGFLGLCPLKSLTDMQPSNLAEVLPAGQTVITRISKVDKEKSRFLGTLRKEECYEGGVESSLKYLHTLLKSRLATMEQLFKDDENLAPYGELRLGSVVEVTVTSSHKKGVLCDVENGMKALATHRHFGSVKPVVGQNYEALVLCVDGLAPCLEVTLDQKMIKAGKTRKVTSKTKLKPGQTLKADLQLIKPDYMVMSLRGHGAGAFIHIPTKQIINDIHGTPSYKEGMFSDVVVKRVEKDYAVGVLKMNDPEFKKNKDLFKKGQCHNAKIGDVLEAKVKNVHPMQMNIITDVGGVQGRVHITESLDEPVEGKHPLHRYQPNDPVKVKVIGLRDVRSQGYLPITHPKANRTLLECSLKESKMELTEPDDLLTTSLNVSVGDELLVFILQIAAHKVWVQVSPIHQGWVDFFHLSDDAEVANDAEKHFKLGRAHKARVIGTDNDSKLILSFTGIEKEMKVGGEVIARVTGLKPMECLTVKLPTGQFGVIKESPLKTDKLGQHLRCRVKATLEPQLFELTIVGDREGPLMEKEEKSTENPRKRKKQKKTSKTSSGEQTDSGVDMPKASSDSEPEKQDNQTRSNSKATLNIEGFSWNKDLKPQEEAAISDDGDGDDEEAGLTTGKLKKKKKRDDERAIQEYERNQREGVDPDLQSPSDFDRMVLQSPNSSVVWLRYMAHHMELGEVEKARAVAEKALETIAFREEQEKKNVWLAYLNLETMFGNSDDVKKVLERAVTYNDPVEIHLKMCDIYVGADKMDDAEQLYHVITRKFKKDKSVWKSYSQFLYKAGRLPVARNLLQRCLTALDKKDHVEVISKFANLEFAHGDAERGRTMFENLIASYPGRTDIWSVYIDMVTKSGDTDSSRQLLERAVNQKLNTKKLTFLVQKFIKFEETYGTEERVEKVKDLAISLFET